MLLSMTGFGDAVQSTDRLNVAVEIRTVNNRYLKISSRLPDAYGPLESRIEKVARESITRGTVQIAVRIEQVGVDRRYKLDRSVLDAYWHDLCQWSQTQGLATPACGERLLELPGVVVEDNFQTVDIAEEWPVVERALLEALEKLRGFRTEEGRAMRDDLAANGRRIGEQLELIRGRAPQVVAEYRSKMHERVKTFLSEANVSLESSDLLREVSIFADRCDINEEIQRLQCHLEQFETFLGDEQSLGRKLEFLSQEMFREINTIGSKANDVEIAHGVVEMKAAVEKIRENLQNVE